MSAHAESRAKDRRAKILQRKLGEGFGIQGFPFPPPSDIQHKPQPSIQLKAYIIVVTCIACGI